MPAWVTDRMIQLYRHPSGELYINVPELSAVLEDMAKAAISEYEPNAAVNIAQLVAALGYWDAMITEEG